MSWDVMLLSRDPGPIDANTKVPPLGDSDFVRAQISKSLPGVSWSDPAWGVLEGQGWSIEFNHQKTGVTETVMLHVRGSGDPIAAIVKLCKDTGWVAYDVQTGSLIDLKAPSSKSWKEFQGYRDSITLSTGQPPKAPETNNRPLNIGISIVFFGVILWLILRNR